jgi:3-dehydroquinate synthase
MKKVKVNLGSRSYEIVIGSRIINSLGKYLRKLNIGSDAFIITNSFIKAKYGAKLASVLASAGFNFRFKIIADTEKSKSIQTASVVIKDLAKFDRKRKVFIIAFGGGVVGDLSGFVASVYKRGTSYIQIPTTLLAQVDSSIGGKTAVDLDSGKNLVGAYYQPRLVFTDIDFLKSLSQDQIRSGMAEVIKYAVIKDKSLFRYLKNKNKEIIAKKVTALEKIVVACSKIKAKIASCDEKEALGIRTMLNFGHTMGHAIEAAGGYRGYNHGQAVALGMIAAMDLSHKLNLCSVELVADVSNLIKLYGLPVKIKGIGVDKIIKAHFHDKKFSGKENKFVLIWRIGNAKIVRNIKLDLIKEAVRRII